MKVIWGKFGTGVDLILCVIINYYVVSIWVNGKDEFHAYSLKTSIIFLIEVMLVLNMGKTDRSDRYQQEKISESSIHSAIVLTATMTTPSSMSPPAAITIWNCADSFAADNFDVVKAEMFKKLN